MDSLSLPLLTLQSEVKHFLSENFRTEGGKTGEGEETEYANPNRSVGISGVVDRSCWSVKTNIAREQTKSGSQRRERCERWQHAAPLLLAGTFVR